MTDCNQTMRRTLLGALVLAGLLGGCAAPAPSWQKAGVTDGEVRRDLAACRGFAASEADRRYQRDNPAGEVAAGTGRDTPAEAFESTMATNEAVLFRDRVLTECMEEKGYRKVIASTRSR